MHRLQMGGGGGGGRGRWIKGGCHQVSGGTSSGGVLREGGRAGGSDGPRNQGVRGAERATGGRDAAIFS